MKPIELEDATIEWLAERQAEWPEELVEDLNEIHRHNLKCEEILSK